MVRWPEHIPAGTERKEFFHHIDVMATLSGLAGVTLPAGASPDGKSDQVAWLEPVKAPAARSEAVLHGTRSMALRQGPWVYLAKQGSGGKTVPEPEKPWSIPYKQMKLSNSDVDENGQVKENSPAEQLYHLGNDQKQQTNLATQQPALVKKMRERLKEILNEK
jgi:arylsulfatase A-like enzyme